ncbi:MAG: metallophosphatase domain-containing protein [Bacteroidales bacterium]|nr:metallophosphatase domain-containing protein [Bacteroidales bacterium]
MIIVALSDTHGNHHAVDVPPGDIIIHCGDITRKSNPSEVADFIRWFAGLDFQYKILVAGNHDRFIRKKKPEFLELTGSHNITYLENTSIRINGYSIFGSPFSLNYGGIGAFTYFDTLGAERIWNLIPENINILVTHAPPRGFRDFSKTENYNAGCQVLREKVLSIKPRYHIFGHIHESYGTETHGNSVFINASLSNGSGEIVNKPVVFEF